MTNIEAKCFLLESKNYANFQIPEYFDFQKILNKVDKFISGKDLKSFHSTKIDASGKNKVICPSELENVNYKFVNNKDGKYSYRPFQLIHPVLYTSLVQLIAEKDNWIKLGKRFKKLHKNPSIECVSMPVKSIEDNITDLSATILNWWSNIEQKSIELAMDYDYVIHTDITNCYPNIYTHSIAWAIETKKVAKKTRDKSLLGNKIDVILQSMSYGQTNGIPQGSVLMDFIAEMVLGYADLQLSKRIKRIKNEYKILRYRDDYRIFANSPILAEEIMKNLTDVLSDLGLSLGASKTIVSQDIIRTSIKKDKLAWITTVNYRYSFQKQLLLINDFSHRYPNSGQLSNALEKFYSRIEKFKKEFNDTHALISIIVDIAFRNPRVYPISTAIISVLIKQLTKKNQKVVINKTIKKFGRIPNTGHMMIWLQRIVVGNSPNQKFDERLCKIVSSEKKKLWNSKWLNGRLKELVDNTEIINKKTIKKLDKQIPIESVKEIGYSASIDLGDPIILQGKEAEELVEFQKKVEEYLNITNSKSKNTYSSRRP